MHWFCNVASNSPSPVSLAQISSGSGRMLVVRDAPNTSPNSGATGRFTASLAAHLETEFTHAVTGQPLTGTLTSAPNSNTKHFMASSSWKSWNPKVKLGVHDRMFYDVHAASTCSTDGTWWHNGRASPGRPWRARRASDVSDVLQLLCFSTRRNAGGKSQLRASYSAPWHHDLAD